MLQDEIGNDDVYGVVIQWYPVIPHDDIPVAGWIGQDHFVDVGADVLFDFSLDRSQLFPIVAAIQIEPTTAAGPDIEHGDSGIQQRIDAIIERDSPIAAAESSEHFSAGLVISSC